MFLRFVGTLLLLQKKKKTNVVDIYIIKFAREHVTNHIFLNFYFYFIFIKNYFFMFLDCLKVLILKIIFKK
jgi:hypothetical protein